MIVTLILYVSLGNRTTPRADCLQLTEHLRLVAKLEVKHAKARRTLDSILVGRIGNEVMELTPSSEPIHTCSRGPDLCCA